MKLGHITEDSSKEDEGEKNGEPTNQTVGDIQVTFLETTKRNLKNVFVC